MEIGKGWGWVDWAGFGVEEIQNTNRSAVSNIPLNHLTLISDDELQIKLDNDTIRGAKIIRKISDDEDSTDNILTTADGSVCAERERITSAFEVIFKETSPLNIVENTFD